MDMIPDLPAERPADELDDDDLENVSGAGGPILMGTEVAPTGG